MRRTLWALGATVALAIMVAPITAHAKKGCYSKKVEDEADATSAAAYKVEKGKNLDFTINASLTGKPGNADKGIEWIVNRKLGNCIACHKVSAIDKKAKPDDQASQGKYGFHGEIGPELDGLADRYTEGEIRMLVVDPKKIFPDTIMPAFHKVGGLIRVKGACKGKVMLSASRIEDVVAYLKTLK